MSQKIYYSLEEEGETVPMYAFFTKEGAEEYAKNEEPGAKIVEAEVTQVGGGKWKPSVIFYNDEIYPEPIDMPKGIPHNYGYRVRVFESFEDYLYWED